MNKSYPYSSKPLHDLNNDIIGMILIRLFNKTLISNEMKGRGIITPLADARMVWEVGGSGSCPHMFDRDD